MRALPPERYMVTTAAESTDAASDGLVDVKHVKQLLGFVVRSVWRHRLLFTSVFSIVIGLAIAAYVVMPRQYLVQTRLFAQRSFVMPSLNNPRRTVPTESDAPTRMASETVMRRENLVAIIKETNLLADWRATRAPALRFKDYLVTLISGEQSEAEWLEALVGTMERRLWVTTDEGTVTIGVLWSDASLAFRIVNIAQRNFISERHNTEVSAIQESIGILDRQAANVHTSLLESYAELVRNTPVEAQVATRPRRSAASEEQIGNAQTSLSAKRLAITDLEGLRRRRMEELQTRLAEQRNTYGARHPALAATEQSIEEASKESPQLTQLRQDERRIVGELRRLGVDPNASQQPGTNTFDQNLARAALASIGKARGDSLQSERLSALRTRVQMAEHEYEDLLQRLQGARIELETARAAFKYRYGVITPAILPNRPIRPLPIVFLGAGLVLAGFLAFFAAVAVDVGSGRLLESWQVERILGLKVLREVTAK